MSYLSEMKQGYLKGFTSMKAINAKSIVKKKKSFDSPIYEPSENVATCASFKLYC